MSDWLERQTPAVQVEIEAICDRAGTWDADGAVLLAAAELVLAARLEGEAAGRVQWQPIATAPKDGTLILGALIRNGRVWRVHDMQHNGLAFYTASGNSVPEMTHWVPMPLPAAPAGMKEITVCLGCGCDVNKRDCGCPAGTGKRSVLAALAGMATEKEKGERE